MSEKPRGQIITFYSYKGGVGRSMALANIATLLAQRGKRVLVLDLDLEAPGLHRYFLGEQPELSGSRVKKSGSQTGGVVEFFSALRDQLGERLPDGVTEPVSGSLPILQETIQRVLDLNAFEYSVRLRNPNATAPGKQAVATLQFMPAGRVSEGKIDPGYAEKVHALDWKDFYARYAEVFPLLAEEWGRRYDYVLIDSRTGISDIGSICTMMLPEKLVLVFSPNDQSLMGALEVGRQAVTQRQTTDDLRPLPLFPLISRVEDSEEKLKQDWIGRARKSFEVLFESLYGLEDIRLGEYFELARIPHRSFYAFGERIAAEEQTEIQTGSLAQAYHQFIECLGYGNPNEVRDIQARKVEALRHEVLDKIEDEDALKEMIARSPDDAQPLLLLGDLLQNRGRLSEAIAAYNDLVARFSLSGDTATRMRVAAALLGKALCLRQTLSPEEEGEPGEPNWLEDVLASYREVVRRFGDATEPELREAVARALVNEGRVLEDLMRYEETMVRYEEATRRFAEASEAKLQGWAALAFFSKGKVLQRLSREEEALAQYDELIQRYSTSAEILVRQLVARTFIDKSRILLKQERYEAALGCGDEVVRRFGEDTDPRLREISAAAFIARSTALRKLKRREEEIADYDELERRFGASSELVLRRHVTGALLNKGNTLKELAHHAEALDCYDQVVRRLGDELMPDPALRMLAARALLSKGNTFRDMERDEDALDCYDEVVRRFNDASLSQTALRVPIARALANKGSALGDLERYEQALDCYDEVVRRFGDIADPALRELIARVLDEKVSVLNELARYEEMLPCCDDIVRRFIDSPKLSQRARAANALVAKGLALQGLGRHEQSLDCYVETIRLFGDAPELNLRDTAVRALFFEATARVALTRYEEALGCYDEVLRRIEGTADEELVFLFAQVLIDKALTLQLLERFEEALACCDEAVRRFDASSELELRQCVAQAFLNKATIFRGLVRYEDVWISCDEVVRRLEDAPEDALRALMNSALALGVVARVLDAKRHWSESGRERVTASLELAGQRLALLRTRVPKDSFLLFMDGYLAFLQGRQDEARLSAEASRADRGEKFDIGLQILDVHTIPEDEEFRKLLSPP